MSLMHCRVPITAIAVLAGLIFVPTPCLAEVTNSSYKVLARDAEGFNVSSVQALLEKGD